MALIDELAHKGLAVHGFGLKTRALAAGLALVSSDSQAWSAQARRQQVRLAGCTHPVCSYCPRYAARWRAQLVERGLAR